MILIYKNSQEHITENFIHAELFTNSSDYVQDCHKFDEVIINALQLIRSHYGVRIKVLSTYRTPKHNEDVGGKPNSLHLFFRAIDWQFIGKGAKEAMKQYQKDIEAQDDDFFSMFRILRKAGVGGFGLYKTFNHIDSRNAEVVPVFNNSDEFGQYSFFNYK